MSSEDVYVNFDTDGQWDAAKLRGPAIHAPDHIRRITVQEYRIEWLDASDSVNQVLKNHLVTALVFWNPVQLNGKSYQSAQLSMELADDEHWLKKAIARGKDHLEPLVEFHTGTYELRLREYSTPNQYCVHERKYGLKQGTTIGNLIDQIVGRKMHHFCFLPYASLSPPHDRWKGCGDHTLHCWAVLFREGIITRQLSADQVRLELWRDIGKTFYSDKEGNKPRVPAGDPLISAELKICRGWWVSWKPVKDDDLTPDDAFSNQAHDGRLVID